MLDLWLGETEGISLFRALRDARNDPTLIFISRLDERVITASLRLAVGLGLRVAGMLQKPASPCALRELLRDAPPRPGTSARSPTTARQVSPNSPSALQRGIDRAAFPTADLACAKGGSWGSRHSPAGPSGPARCPPPEIFVPLAEQSGLIVPLTFHIMRASLEACGRWRGRHPDCRVAVNISPLVLADPRLPDEIEQLLAETGLGPGALIAEITESCVIANPLARDRGFDPAADQGDRTLDRRFRYRALVFADPAPAAVFGTEDRPLIHFAVRNRSGGLEDRARDHLDGA